MRRVTHTVSPTITPPLAEEPLLCTASSPVGRTYHGMCQDNGYVESGTGRKYSREVRPGGLTDCCP